MNAALQTPETVRRSPPAPIAAAQPIALDRDTAQGPFSFATHGPIGIDVEPGLRVRVLAGCLWLPDSAEQCSVGVGAGESFAPVDAGRIHAMARRGTQVELVWPDTGVRETGGLQ